MAALLRSLFAAFDEDWDEDCDYDNDCDDANDYDCDDDYDNDYDKGGPRAGGRYVEEASHLFRTRRDVSDPLCSIRFRVVPAPLQIGLFRDPRPTKHVVIAFCLSLETRSIQQSARVLEGNVGVARSAVPVRSAYPIISQENLTRRGVGFQRVRTRGRVRSHRTRERVRSIRTRESPMPPFTPPCLEDRACSAWNEDKKMELEEAGGMHRIRVYVDTSVFGGTQDEEFAEASRHFFDQVKRGKYLVLVSEVTLDEISRTSTLLMG